MKLKDIDGSRLKEISRRYQNHQITAFSAQMAFFLFLSIFPLAMFILSLASRLNIDIDAAMNNINSGLPEDTKEMILNLINNYLKNDSVSLISISGVAALWSASRGVSSLRTAFNAAYGREETRNPLIVKLISMLYTLIFIISIIITLSFPAFGREFFLWLNNFIYIPEYVVTLFYWIRFGLSTLVYMFFILMIHTALPAGKLKYRETIYGTLFSIVAWFLLAKGFNIFVSGFTNYAIVYGGLASIVTLMMFLYFLSIVMMMGAEINSTIMAYKSNDYPFDKTIFKKSNIPGEKNDE